MFLITRSLDERFRWQVATVVPEKIHLWLGRCPNASDCGGIESSLGQ